MIYLKAALLVGTCCVVYYGISLLYTKLTYKLSLEYTKQAIHLNERGNMIMDATL